MSSRERTRTEKEKVSTGPGGGPPPPPPGDEFLFSPPRREPQGVPVFVAAVLILLVIILTGGLLWLTPSKPDKEKIAKYDALYAENEINKKELATAQRDLAVAKSYKTDSDLYKSCSTEKMTTEKELGMMNSKYADLEKQCRPRPRQVINPPRPQPAPSARTELRQVVAPPAPKADACRFLSDGTARLKSNPSRAVPRDELIAEASLQSIAGKRNASSEQELHRICSEWRTQQRHALFATTWQSYNN